MATAHPIEHLNSPQTLDLALLDHLPESTTLLELVFAISAIAENDDAVVDAVLNMLAQGRVKLRGNFRDCGPSCFED